MRESSIEQLRVRPVGERRFADVASMIPSIDVRRLRFDRHREIGLETLSNVLELSHARPVLARSVHLTAISNALTDEGVEYFAVPGFRDGGSTLGIEEASRERALQVFREAFSTSPLNVRVISPRPRTLLYEFNTSSRNFLQTCSDSTIIRLYWNIYSGAGSHVYAEDCGVELQFWRADDWREGVHSFTHLDDDERAERILAPTPNRAARLINTTDPYITADATQMTRLHARGVTSGSRVATRPPFVRNFPDQIQFPVDVVYTWVDGADPVWLQRRHAHASSFHAQDAEENSHNEAASAARFLTRDELRYSLRSLYANAPWVNHVYIVTDSQVPEWFDDSAPGVTIVDHSEIFEDENALPVFNSHAIEANLHRVPGLSEHFLYLNDDMFLGRPIVPNKFFQPNGLAKHFPSHSRVPFTKKGPKDSPVDAATKNNRELIKRDFGVDISQVMEHAPYALRKSVLEEMEARYPQEFAATSRARLRSPADLNVPSNFAHHYGFLTARSIPARLKFTYIGLSVRDLRTRLERLLARRDRDAFCLNDTFSTADDLVAQVSTLTPFLEDYFPVPSPWELPS